MIFISFSCSENKISIDQEPSSITLDNNEYYYGDTITIYGNALSFFESYVEVRLFSNDTSISISSDDFLIWNSNNIKILNLFNNSIDSIKVVKDEVETNSQEIVLLAYPKIMSNIIPSQSFTMGFNQGNSDEIPEHDVTISNDLEVSIYEINARLFNLVVNGDPNFSSEIPVSNIDWFECLYFCNELSKMQGFEAAYSLNDTSFIGGSNGWRLPTEAEWEMLAKAGENFQIPNGENLNDIAWYNENSAYSVKPIGQKLPNDFGLYDIIGNLSEWCWDYYSSNYYSVSPSENPYGPESGDFRVRRGGSFDLGKSRLRASYRMRFENDLSNVGFRIVRTP